MVKNLDITHGSIFAIPLGAGLGYMYGKMIFGSHLKNPWVRRRTVFVKVYDYRTEDVQMNFSNLFFEKKELFADPFMLIGSPKFKGTNSWKFIIDDSIRSEDEFIPHYLQVNYYEREQTDSLKEFFVLEYGTIGNPNNRFYPFYRVKHLPIHRFRSYDIIGIYLTYAWLKRNGMNVDEAFKFKEGLDVKKEIRFEVMNMAIDYSKIPKEIRGRVAPEGINGELFTGNN